MPAVRGFDERSAGDGAYCQAVWSSLPPRLPPSWQSCSARLLGPEQALDCEWPIYLAKPGQTDITQLLVSAVTHTHEDTTAWTENGEGGWQYGRLAVPCKLKQCHPPKPDMKSLSK